MIEKELKFKIENMEELVGKLKGAKPYIVYCKDEIFGKAGVGYKIRKRIILDDLGITINYEKTMSLKTKIKTIQKEKVDGIPKGFKIENSYDKTRFLYFRNKCLITIDIYFFGIFCEIEGAEKIIRKTAENLGFDIKNNIKENIDTLYCQLARREKRKELLHWGFGRF